MWFFHWCHKFLYLFVCLVFPFFNSILIVSWFLFKCALTWWIKWRQYCYCLLQDGFEQLSVVVREKRLTWKVLIFFHIVFTNKFFAYFWTWTLKGNYASFKRIICVFILIPSHLLRSRKFSILYFLKLPSSVEFCCHISSCWHHFFWLIPHTGVTFLWLKYLIKLAITYHTMWTTTLENIRVSTTICFLKIYLFDLWCRPINRN